MSLFSVVQLAHTLLSFTIKLFLSMNRTSDSTSSPYRLCSTFTLEQAFTYEVILEREPMCCKWPILALVKGIYSA